MTNLFAELHHQLPREFKDPKPILIDITNVTHYVQHLQEDEFEIMEEMTYLPWGRCWFEYRQPTTQRIKGKVVDYADSSMDWTVGIFAQLSRDKSQVEFHVYIKAFYDATGDKDLIYVGTNFRGVGDTGETSPVFINPSWERYISQGIISRQLLIEICSREVCNVLYANMFAHCRNVTYYEKNHPEKLRKRNEKRGKVPQETYRILDIDGLQKQAKSEATESEGELKRALHICRGHFRTYTEESPLFGKVTGTFWVPMHKRGSEKHGKVNKDYRIKP